MVKNFSHLSSIFRFINSFLERSEINGQTIEEGWESRLDLEANDIIIQGSNNTDSKGFFDKHFIVQFFIGPRGGVKVKVCN